MDLPIVNYIHQELEQGRSFTHMMETIEKSIYIEAVRKYKSYHDTCVKLRIPVSTFQYKRKKYDLDKNKILSSSHS